MGSAGAAPLGRGAGSQSTDAAAARKVGDSLRSEHMLVSVCALCVCVFVCVCKTSIAVSLVLSPVLVRKRIHARMCAPPGACSRTCVVAVKIPVLVVEYKSRYLHTMPTRCTCA